eukprot:8770675-Alexandrium_andersonii.AAC.1
MNFDLDGGSGHRSQEGWSAYADGAPLDSRDSAQLGRAGSELPDSSLLVSVGRVFHDDITGA